VNGVHDLGGMHGFGAITIEANEPVFHADWERRLFGLALAIMGSRFFNVDEFRRTIERMPPSEYLAASYYERWLHALENLLVEKGVLASGELDGLLGHPEPNVVTSTAVSLQELAERDETRDDEPALGEEGTEHAAPGSAALLRYDAAFKPRFKVGDRVVARNINPEGHTRLPRYVRGHHGVVEHDWGVFVLPDTHAHGLGANPQHCYCVSFSARELWGADRPANEKVNIDLWEEYLEFDRASSDRNKIKSRQQTLTGSAGKPHQQRIQKTAARQSKSTKIAASSARARKQARGSSSTPPARKRKKAVRPKRVSRKKS
jgi:nitrile hydratase beta subunit